MLPNFVVERQGYIEAVSFQMENQDPERGERNTNGKVNLKTENGKQTKKKKPRIIPTTKHFYSKS